MKRMFVLLKLYQHTYIHFFTGQPAATKTSDESHLVPDVPLQWLLHHNEELVGIYTLRKIPTVHVDE